MIDGGHVADVGGIRTIPHGTVEPRVRRARVAVAIDVRVGRCIVGVHIGAAVDVRTASRRLAVRRVVTLVRATGVAGEGHESDEEGELPPDPERIPVEDVVIVVELLEPELEVGVHSESLSQSALKEQLVDY